MGFRVNRVLYGSYAPKSLSFRWQADRARSMKREVDYSREPNVTYDRPQMFFLRQSSKQQADGDDLDFRLRSNILIKQSAQGLPTATRDVAKTADEILRVVEDESSNRVTNSLGMNIDPSLDSFSRTRGLAQDCFERIAPRGAVMIRLSPTENVARSAPRTWFVRQPTTCFAIKASLCRSRCWTFVTAAENNRRDKTSRRSLPSLGIVPALNAMLARRS